MHKKPVSLTITKLDAAKRQIEAAISLWFQDGDPVAVHTLIAAGHHVCHDIAKARGRKSPFLFDSELHSPNEWFSHKKYILTLENFLKHAERDADPNAALTFSPEETDFYIFDAILLHQIIGGKYTPLMECFTFRFMLFHPHCFEEHEFLFKDGAIEARSMSRSDFLNTFLKESQAIG